MNGVEDVWHEGSGDSVEVGKEGFQIRWEFIYQACFSTVTVNKIIFTCELSSNDTYPVPEICPKH